MSPYEAYDLALENGPSKKLEKIIQKSATCSYLYARDVLKGPFRLGERSIATNDLFPIAYACDILNGPFPLGENSISKKSLWSYLYARYAIKKPYPDGEFAISKDAKVATDYQFRFNRDICSFDQLAEYPAYALAYAIMIGGRFPEGEPAMKRSPRIWKRYQGVFG